MPLSDAHVLRLAHQMRAQVGARPDAIAAAIAERQEGAIATAQLALAGIGRGALRTRVAGGRLHPMLRGVHAMGHRPTRAATWWHAALLAAGPRGALSHRSAAQAWGLVAPTPILPVDVTVPGARGRPSHDRLRIHSSRLDARDTLLRDGLRTTTVARTLLDLAEALADVERVVDVLDRAEALRLHRPRAVSDVLARADGRHGARVLREALLIARPQDMLTRSRLERRALRMVAAHDLPRPQANVKVHGEEVDLFWPEARLVVELDGRTYHGDGIALDHDHRRDADLQAQGLRILRFTWRQVSSDPAWVADRIRALLRTTEGPARRRGPRALASTVAEPPT